MTGPAWEDRAVSPTTDLITDLEARGLVHDATDLGALRARLAAGPIGAYVGFDPTADSLHVGNLFGQVTLRRFQLAGHRPFPLAGGATGMVGDPSGRSEERNLLDRDTLRANVGEDQGAARTNPRLLAGSLQPRSPGRQRRVDRTVGGARVPA